jgi:two-component system chemotaxis response regulator CheY
VLVVDDQTSVRQMTRLTLEQIGVKLIHEAENGNQAVEKATV